METITFNFKDDGRIPNSNLPLLMYKNAFSGDSLTEAMKDKFADNNWGNAWRDGVFPYHHYHSITHEVLGICCGNGKLHMGGENGEVISVNAGDVLIIPAGVGHKKVSASDDFAVIGAYPDGMEYDLMTGEDGERPRADDRIAKVPLPKNDPVLGSKGGSNDYWKNIK